MPWTEANCCHQAQLKSKQQTTSQAYRWCVWFFKEILVLFWYAQSFVHQILSEISLLIICEYNRFKIRFMVITQVLLSFFQLLSLMETIDRQREETGRSNRWEQVEICLVLQSSTFIFALERKLTLGNEAVRKHIFHYINSSITFTLLLTRKQCWDYKTNICQWAHYLLSLSLDPLPFR